MAERSAGTPELLDLSPLEALATTRSIRRYLDEPVPDEDLNQILWTATRAPSGTNRQPFRFLVLRNGPRAQRARRVMGDAFRAGWSHKVETEGWNIDLEQRGASRRERMLQTMQHYVDRFERIPVIVLALYVPYRATAQRSLMDGASVYPACQNLLVAARSLGYGACFSGWHVGVADELHEILGIPESVEIALTITLGRPEGNHGPVRRRPIAGLVFDDGWEEPAPWAHDPPGTRFTGGGPPKAT